MPGKYAVYLSQTVQWRHPVFIDDVLRVVGTVQAKHDSVRTIEIQTDAFVKDTLVANGLAIVKVLQ